MQSKKVLTLLLAVCMVLSLLTPAASAVGSSNVPNAPAGQNSGLTVNGPAAQLSLSLRNDPISQTGTEEPSQTGSWSAVPTQGKGVLADATSERMQELRRAAELYADTDVVAAFIVMEDAPLAEEVASIQSVTPAQTDALLSKQNTVIAAVERDVLSGSKLDVRYQFTYLTNAISVRVPFGKLSAIGQVKGVAGVYLMPVYEPCTTDASDLFTVSSGEGVGVPTVWKDLGYTGAGMTISIIDTGLDLDHPSFAAAPKAGEGAMTKADITAVLGKLNASKLYKGLTADKVFYSEKIPYAFNYVDRNLTADHSRDQQGYHGTHVAGIAAANAVEGSGVVGMAPDAQIVVMKVFGAAGGAFTDDILAALEDSLTLGVDVVNMSLGSPAGFSSTDPEIDAIYNRIGKQDVIVNVAAGNEGVSSAGNQWGTDLNQTSNPDNATISQPATYANTTVVASADNFGVMSAYMMVGETKVAYADANGLYVTFDSLGTDPMDYVVLPGFGTEDEYEGVDVAGKIAVVSRGNLSFGNKLAIAESKGAKGLIVYNNQPGSIIMTMVNEDGSLMEGVSGMVPAVSISAEDGQLLKDAAEKKVSVGGVGLMAGPNAGQMSSFSCWGVAPDLRLLPDVTGIGGDVYSTIDGGEYGTMSGTSMASPMLAGISALVLEYVHKTYPTLSAAGTRKLADSLIMSTAVPVVSKDSGVEASPRQQGSGLVNALGAVTSGAYLTVPGSDKPKVELGDDVSRTGSYTFSFQVNNLTDKAKTYTLSASVLTEDYIDLSGFYFMAGVDCALPATVTFDADTVTVPANGTATVKVSIVLADEAKTWLDTYYENGGYVEGYVHLTAEEGGVDLALPYLGFFGDWTEAPVLDGGAWYDEVLWNDDYQGLPTAEEYWTIPFTTLGGLNWMPGMNPYTGEFDGYDPTHFVFSPNGDGMVDGFAEIYVALMRNARNVTITFSNADTGEVYDSRSLPYISKTMFRSSYGSVVPMVYSWYEDSFYQFTDGVGKTLPSGTAVDMTIYAALDFDAHKQTNDRGTWKATFIVDNEAPALLSVDTSATADGNFITITARDNTAIAGIQLVNPAQTQVMADFSSTVEPDENGVYTVVMDVTGLGNEMILVLGDYGANESLYKLYYTLDSNRPEVDKTALYGYRIFDEKINNDTQYGWVTLDKETAEVDVLTSDYMEGFSLNAAEYAGGYVFAVDAANDFMVMVPGLWNRTTIANLDVTAYDMTFDRTTDTMYLLAKSDTGYGLYTIDLLNGDLKQVADFGKVKLWNIAADAKGTIYAIQEGKGELYYLDKENDFAVTMVMLDEETPVTLMSGEKPIAPISYQSMTYSYADGKLYYAYYGGMWYGKPSLYAIDTETYEYTATQFASASEYVGLLTLEDGVVTDTGDDHPSEKFTDVKQGSYYENAVDFAVSRGIVKGITETTFEPMSLATRGQMVTMLYRLAGAKAEPTDKFTDVPANSYCAEAVAWALAAGITTGTTETTFSPNEPLTREQMATFMYRYAASQGLDVLGEYSSLAQFTDADQVSRYAVGAVRWAVAKGLLNGVTADTLVPKGVANRAMTVTVLYRLYCNVVGSYQIPASYALEGLLLDRTRGDMPAGETGEIHVNPIPWNYRLDEVTWTSSDESVAVVNNGKVTGVAAGTAIITASVGDISAECVVNVVEIQGEIYAYNYYTANVGSGDLRHMDLTDVTDSHYVMDCPVDFAVGDYNGHDGYIYGYTNVSNRMAKFNPSTGDYAVLGDSINGVQILDMAYDYSTATMYASVGNPSNGTSQVCVVDMHTGKMTPYGMSPEGSVYMTLACSTDGTLYAITKEGVLVKVVGMDFDPFMEINFFVEEVVVDGLGGLAYAQSMGYDHNNDAIVWAYVEAGTMVWIDPATGVVMALGNPAGGNIFQYSCVFSRPKEIPALPEVALESLTAEPMTLLSGASKMANVTLNPLNATNVELFWSTGDATVVTVDANGVLTARKPGETTVTVTAISGETSMTATFPVTVLVAADNIYGYLMTDMEFMGGDVWIELNDANPTAYEILAPSDYTVYGAEYHDGKLYAYMVDSVDWEAHFQFVVMDAETYEIEEMHDMGEVFPWVYDMAYDYTTSTMYALAGYSDEDSDLYIVDMRNGELLPCLVTDEETLFMSIAVDANGQMYGITASSMAFDPMTWQFTATPAALYTINPEEGYYDFVGETGVNCNKTCSMAFDYDTGNLYWTGLYAEGFFGPYVGGLYYVNTETGAANLLGSIGNAGSQVVGLYIVADNFPEEPEPMLQTVGFNEPNVVLPIGATTQLKPFVMPYIIEDEVSWTWESFDPSVATVDDKGVVTAVAPGSTEVVATATYGDVTKEAICTVGVLGEQAAFISYSTKNNGFATIDRGDYSVKSITPDAEGMAPMVSMEYVEDDIFGYDTEGNFYMIDDETFERTLVGEKCYETVVDEAKNYRFEMRDLAYDPDFGVLFGLGCYYYGPNAPFSEGYTPVCKIYEIDPTTGESIEICTLDCKQARGLTVDDMGNLYIYETYESNFRKVDLFMDPGATTIFAPGYSQMLYGADTGALSLDFDPLSGNIYMLYTGNNRYYKLVSCSTRTGMITVLGDIGEITMEGDYKVGDTFTGLLVKN